MSGGGVEGEWGREGVEGVVVIFSIGQALQFALMVFTESLLTGCCYLQTAVIYMLLLLFIAYRSAKTSVTKSVNI